MRVFLWSLLLGVLLAQGCAPLARKPGIVGLPKTPEMQQAFDGAEAFFLAKKYAEANLAYHTYLTQFPYNALTPKVNYRLGEIQLVQKQWKAAIPFYRESLKKGIFPEWGFKAIYQWAVCSYRLGEFRDTFQVLDQLPRDADSSLRVKAGSLRVNAAKKGRDPLQEIKGYLELTEAYSTLPSGERETGELTWLVSYKEAQQAVRQWVESAQAEKAELKVLLKRFSGQNAGGYILWKAVRLNHQKGDYRKALQLIERFLQDYPKNEYIPAARALQAELGKRDTGWRAKVGVILPLSGAYAVYGESVLHGLECAAGIFSPCRGDLGVRLEIRDSEGDPKTAARLIQELASDQEVMAIIGPLSQLEADEAVKMAEEVQIPLIALSQNPDLAVARDFVFRNFLTVSDQVATLVDYACREKKLKEFAILYPEGAGGEEYRKKFEENVTACGGEVVSQQGFSPAGDSLLGPLRNLKLSRGRQKVAEKAPFQALFFPGVYRQIPELLANLKFLNMGEIQLLGGPGWDHPDLLHESAEGLEGAVFVNGFYAHSEEFTTKDFVASFQAAYGMEPTLLEAYAYDTLRLVGRTLGASASTRPSLRDALALVKNFNGVTGTISFDDEGDARRRLFLLRVDQGEVREVR